MLSAILLLTLLLGGGAILASALAITRRKRLDLGQRLTLVPGASIRDAARVSARSPEPREIEARHRIGRLLLLNTNHPWETKAGVAKLAIAAVISAGMTWLLSRHMFGASIAIAVPVSAFASFLLPRFILIRERKRAEAAFTDMFPDAVDSAARMLRAGLPITSAMQTIGNEAAPPVNVVFSKLADQIRIGIPLAEALSLSSQQIQLADFRFFSVAIVLQQSAGGNLVSTLEVLSQIMRKRRAVRLKAKAITSEVRFSAYLLGALPFLTTLALLAIQPDYLTPLFADRRGHLILGIAAGGLILSALTMRRMMGSINPD